MQLILRVMDQVVLRIKAYIHKLDYQGICHTICHTWPDGQMHCECEFRVLGVIKDLSYLLPIVVCDMDYRMPDHVRGHHVHTLLIEWLVKRLE